MPVTININNLTLVHKSSNGIAIATLPDVCKTPTPNGPIPIPYPNIAKSSLRKGTRTVKVDGGNMAAIKGSEFSISTGDEAGSLGGIKSGTFKKEATWISYSFDVRMEGKNACRLTDKMFMNHGNTVCMAGVNQMMLQLRVHYDLARLCILICLCDMIPFKSKSEESDLRQECVKRALDLWDNPPGRSHLKAEISYNMREEPPVPLMHRDPNTGKDTLARSYYIPERARQIPGFKAKSGHIRRPDVVIVADRTKTPTQDNILMVVEVKFPPQTRDLDQDQAYIEIAGSKEKYMVLTPKKCGCDEIRRELKKKMEEEQMKDELFKEVIVHGLGGLAFGLAAAGATVLTPGPPEEIPLAAASATQAHKAKRALDLLNAAMKL